MINLILHNIFTKNYGMIDYIFTVTKAVMNTLTISNELIKLGMDKQQSDFIAIAIDEKNQEIVTKADVESVKNHSNTLVFGLGAVTIVGFGYLLNSINNNHDLLNTIVSKLG